MEKLDNIIIIIVYLYSAQYLHILQDSKHYLSNPSVQVQLQLLGYTPMDSDSGQSCQTHKWILTDAILFNIDVDRK